MMFCTVIKSFMPLCLFIYNFDLAVSRFMEFRLSIPEDLVVLLDFPAMPEFLLGVGMKDFLSREVLQITRESELPLRRWESDLHIGFNFYTGRRFHIFLYD